jgi:uncharacterized membrane protein (UPF0127 family)
MAVRQIKIPFAAWRKERYPSFMSLVKITNATRGTGLAGKAAIADSPRTRRRGLLGSRELPDGEGLLIIPCRQVHTFGMQYPIDVVFVDGSFKVRRSCKGLKPRRLSPFVIASRAVLELPAGKIAETGTEVGDLLQLLELE